MVWVWIREGKERQDKQGRAEEDEKEVGWGGKGYAGWDFNPHTHRERCGSPHRNPHIHRTGRSTLGAPNRPPSQKLK